MATGAYLPAVLNFRNLQYVNTRTLAPLELWHHPNSGTEKF